MVNNVMNTKYFTHWQGSGDGMKLFWNWDPKIGYLFYTNLKTWIMKKFLSYFIKLLIHFTETFWLETTFLFWITLISFETFQQLTNAEARICVLQIKLII
jgi:hypothetical protein